MVWLAFILMGAAAVLCVSWPLLRPRGDAGGGATDVAFYRQQLRELEADVDRGVLRPTDVEPTRAELGRRLIQAADGTGPSPATGRRHRFGAVLAGAVVLAVAVGLYPEVGHPGEPDAPLAAREAGKSDFEMALAKMEAHLAAEPGDGRGLEIMAPVYMKMGRFDDAARSFRELIRVAGATPARQAALGQALVMSADGVVTAEARGIFDAALQQDPAMPQARFFEGLAALQDGDKGKARTIWSSLIAEAPPEAPYLDILRQRIAELDGVVRADALPPARGPAPGGPTVAGLAPMPGMPGMPAGAAVVAALPADQQRTAIQGMVDGLAARLARDGQDAEGWLKLVRAYRVLGEQDKAVQALADARRSMTGDPQVLGRLDRLAHELGLES